ncbi:MAG: thiamine phosphate synthase [Calditrichaeota bacterium]|nr:thiamine phosphate synthase [Calditrichota bacterium]
MDSKLKNQKLIFNWNLYIITDEILSQGRSHFDVARAAISGGAKVIQLRDKTASSRTLYQSAQKIRDLTREHGISFIVNDRVDIALACDADGVHVGQNDLPAAVVRQLIGEGKILGVSASNLEEALQAESDGANYLGVGPVFEARRTKSDAGQPRGLELITTVKAHCNLPIIAIGGINASNIREVFRSGADGAAVISAVVTAGNIRKAVSNLLEIITSQKGES